MIDVAIIGGGPAGSAAAIACARAGLHTVMFERKSAAVKTCDLTPEESVGPDCVAQLAGLGIDCADFGSPFAGIVSGRHLSLFGRGGPVSGYHLQRVQLDAALRAKAAMTGAVVHEGVTVADIESSDGNGFRLATTDGPISVRWLVDTSGRRTWLTRRFNLAQRKASPPLIARRTLADRPNGPQGAFARFVAQPQGWIWEAATSPTRLVRISLQRAARYAVDSPQSTVTDGTPHVATWRIGRQLAGHRWLIAGEAAAALDPATGSGIALALRSGLAAASAIDGCLARPAVAPFIAARYHDALAMEFNNAATLLSDHYSRLGIIL